ncbi:MAG: preprotein translocase subunit YajC [Candidatus Eisenbacteria bacterium]|nr:preprotein translocase subunit YajC [Candidatus Eisenbacteria bacterium]
MDIRPLLALGASGGSSSSGAPGWSMLILFGGLFVIWWFLFLGPQIKRQKEKQKMLAALKKGDRVLTRGGLLGTIIGVKEKEQIVVVRLSENVKVEVVRSAVEGVLQPEEVVKE